MQESYEVIIQGTVQGVGFRPFLVRLAKTFNLSGSVENRENGVRLVLHCQEDILKSFLVQLENKKPASARVDAIRVSRNGVLDEESTGFLIMKSKKEGANTTLIPPDIATCEECIREMFLQDNDRYLYPFISCAECGPRFSITESLPYDRDKTTMKHFGQCVLCLKEYSDIDNRRFHAQTNCCEDCGPGYELLESKTGKRIREDPVGRTIEMIRKGYIIALKGIGGFSLVCVPENDICSRLRSLKARPQKPFALMARDVETIRGFASVNEMEKEALVSPSRPIVLLSMRDPPWRDTVAPGLDRVGVMLPYMGTHHLLMKEFPVLVVTSGNVPGEMLCATNAEAKNKLWNFCDHLLLHDREIANRCDDSLIRIAADKIVFLRKSRGYVPERIRLPKSSGETILSTGADMKGSFGFSRSGAFLGSQYMGDLAYKMNQENFQDMISRYEQLFDMRATVVVSDSHPGYFSSSLGCDYAERRGIPYYLLQHHLAHIYSAMAEHGLSECIGVAFDGTGHGDDSQVWGGEFFEVKSNSYVRFAHLRYVPMPGGELSARRPSLMADSYLRDSGLSIEDETTLMCEHAPVYTSSVGRLFDAAAAILGICEENTYEGEAAMKLEAVSQGSEKALPWHLDMREDPWKIDVREMIRELHKRKSGGRAVSHLASSFQETVAEIVLQTCLYQVQRSNLKVVCLSGGVFQNKLLLERCSELLTRRGISVHFNERVSPNDEGIALGQAYWYELRM